MFQYLLASTKSRREYVTKLYESINAAVYSYSGAVVTSLPASENTLMIRLVKETTDLKRFLKLPFASQYLYQNRHDANGGQLIKLSDVPVDGAGSSVLLSTTSTWSHKCQVRFRKGEKNEKDLFIEVWRDQERGFITSRKISDKVTKVYNDAIFGSISWSRDETKIAFIGEKPEPAAYKNYWEDEQPKKSEEYEKKREDKEEEKAPTIYLDEKYKYLDDFGETLIGKKRPAIFIFDLVSNTLNEVVGLE